MNTLPLVSLIIPVYNVELYIERCLLSALNQTYQNIEIILVDDCGPDNSITIAQQIIENQPNGNKVRIIKHKQNRGLSAARNTGIDNSRGDYLFFLDSDDELVLTALESLINNLSFCDIVVAEIITSDMKPYCIYTNAILEGNEIIESYFRGNIYSMACDKLYSTDFLKKNSLHFKEGLIHEDYLWTYQVISCANKIRIIDIPVYIYHIRENSLNTNFSLKNIRHYLFGYNIIKSHILKNNLKIQFAADYLVNYAFVFARISIKKCKCTYLDYIDLNIFDNEINYSNIKKYKTKIKYFFFKLPKKMQYIFLKSLYNKEYL
ncbi:MAG: glycosyltransferase family 2 protein [Dysgonomonas sp.]